MDSPPSTTVEKLLWEIGSISPVSPDGLKLWVPNHLTLRGKPIRLDFAMAVVTDKILSMGLQPAGYVEGEGGRVYSFQALGGNH